MSEPIWVTLSEAVAINRAEVKRAGESFGIRDKNLLGSAVAAPQDSRGLRGVTDLVELGFTLALSIARNRPFFHGNKRGGWYAMLFFFAKNDLALRNEDHELYADMFLDVLAGDTPAETLLALLNIDEIY